MKSLMILTLLFSNLAMASYHYRFDCAAEVTEVEKVSTLNQSASGNSRTGEHSFTEVVTLKLATINTSRKCKKAQVKVIIEDQKYKVGDKLNVHISGGHDRSGWYTIKVQEI
jgi:hypothetical protein